MFTHLSLCKCGSACACVLGDGVYPCHVQHTRKLQLVHQQRLAEEKPSTLNNQSSLLAIYNILHYITKPLACMHLHIPVTSLQRLLIIYGSHMLPGAPYYRIITATQKAKKNGNYVDMKWSTKPIRGAAVIDSVSQHPWLNECHLCPWVVVSNWQASARGGLVYWVQFHKYSYMYCTSILFMGKLSP